MTEARRKKRAGMKHEHRASAIAQKTERRKLQAKSIQEKTNVLQQKRRPRPSSRIYNDLYLQEEKDISAMARYLDVLASR